MPWFEHFRAIDYVTYLHNATYRCSSNLPGTRVAAFDTEAWPHAPSVPSRMHGCSLCCPLRQSWTGFAFCGCPQSWISCDPHQDFLLSTGSMISLIWLEKHLACGAHALEVMPSHLCYVGYYVHVEPVGACFRCCHCTWDPFGQLGSRECQLYIAPLLCCLEGCRVSFAQGS